MPRDLSSSPALWNRSSFDLRSDEILAQILDRGTMSDWRELYRLAGVDKALQQRILQVIREVPLPLPRFWLAALASLGVEVELSMKLKPYGEADI